MENRYVRYMSLYYKGDLIDTKECHGFNGFKTNFKVWWHCYALWRHKDDVGILIFYIPAPATPAKKLDYVCEKRNQFVY